KDGRTGLLNQNVLDAALFADNPQENRPGQFLEKAMLSELFYQQLRKHPVPIEEAAIAAIANNSQAMDVYCWLAYRLHAIQKPVHVSWRAIQDQFGGGGSRNTGADQARYFRKNFRTRALELALAVYPDAKVDIDDRGVTLHPSKP